MNTAIEIETNASIKAVEMVVEADKKDPFNGLLVQSAELPFTFYYGKRRILQHQCSRCGQQVEAEFAFGKIVGLGPLSRQGFKENRKQLDIVGRLFDQHLHHTIEGNGFESYLYLSDPNQEKGALLNVSYYQCSHCQAQYLVLYQRQLKDERPPFEPDELRIESIYAVAFDHERLLEVMKLKPAAIS